MKKREGFSKRYKTWLRRGKNVAKKYANKAYRRFDKKKTKEEE